MCIRVLMADLFISYENEVYDGEDPFSSAGDHIFHQTNDHPTQFKPTLVSRQKKDIDFDLFSQESAQYHSSELDCYRSTLGSINFDSNNIERIEDSDSQVRGPNENNNPMYTTFEGIYNRTDNLDDESQRELDLFLSQYLSKMELELAPQTEKREQVKTQETTQTQPMAVRELIVGAENYSAIVQTDKTTFKVIVKPTEEIIKSINAQDPRQNAKESKTNNGGKNFPKKLGDVLLNHLTENKGLKNCKKLFEDKTSWKSLSAFCTGSRAIPELSHAAFLKIFVDFVQETDAQEFKRGNSSQTAQLCHMASIMCLKRGIQEIQKKFGVQYKPFMLKQGYPKMILECEL